ncbi:MAG: hypothetical protein LW690_01745 [Opitutaceae bacterium]|nr:hypothetical protein [Opitutaceae bacterium]
MKVLALRLLTIGILSGAVHLTAQVRPTPLPGGGGNAGGGAILPGGGGGGLLPGGGGGLLPGGGGGAGAITQPTIIAPAGALVGNSTNATVVLGQAGQTGTSGVTYQWSITGGRITSDARIQAITFIADAAGTVSLAVNVAVAGTTYMPTASVAMLSAETAGAMTTTATVASGTNTFTASVPAAQNNDRTFRWTVSGGAQIVSGQGTNSITYRPGAAGLKEIVSNVNLQNVVTIPVRSYVMALGTGAPVVLTVNFGSGGGTYPAGSRIDIVANPPAPGQVFDRWTGDLSVLGNAPQLPLIPRATLTIPAAAATLTATYKAAPVWTTTSIATFNPQNQAGPNNTTTTVSTTLSYHVPANAAGLVFLLHDAGGSSAEWFERPNQLLFARELVAAGYGVAAVNSINRTAGTWAAPAVFANNLDALNHAAAIDRLVSLGAIAAGKPVFLAGHGAGANAAARYADLLASATPARPVKGAVLFLAAGIDTLAVTSKVPQFYALASKDDALGAVGIQTARDSSQLLLGRGVPTGVVATTVSPLYSGRLRSLALTAPFTADDAQAVWSALKTAKIIDENSYPATSASVATVSAALPAAYRGRAADIAAEIAVAAAEREFFSEGNSRVINFLNNRASDAPPPPPGRLVNLSTRGNVAFLGDSLTVGFNISGTAQATLLIRGIGPGLTRFGVPTALSAPRLEVNRQGTATPLASNEGWDRPGNASTPAQISAAAAAVGAFALTNGAADSALLLQLNPGTYTATIRGLGGSVGEVLAEVYDVSRNATRLTNLSTLSRINSDGDLLIPGIVIAGNNPRSLVIRAVAQGLQTFGYGAADVLGDPRLLVYSGQTVVTNNNNWAQAGATALTAAFPAVGAFPLTNAADSALLEPLTPGSYTLQAGATPLTAQQAAAANAPSQTGSVLVEIYEIP